MANVVIAYVSDLIFQAKIAATARAAGVQVRVATNIARLKELLLPGEAQVLLIDLNANSDPLGAICEARQAGSVPRTVCFVSHVDRELADAARQFGADEVLARSEFVERLPELLANQRAE